MSHRSKVTATYRLDGGDLFQVTVTAATCYPDALNQARSEAVRGVTDLVAVHKDAWIAEGTADD
jgi:hypothetical protein